MVASPGFANQSAMRMTFRIAGILLVVAGLTLTVIAFRALFDTMSSDFTDGPPSSFFLGFIGLPLLGVGGWCLQAGFGGAAARYAAGEVAPVVKESLEYVRSGPFCSKCGTRNDETARFCDACGSPLG